MKKRKIIVLMPVKNEAWILPMSLKAASVWADRIIVSDQGSVDGSKEIARSFPKVLLIENEELKDFNEYKMREPLIRAARDLEGMGNILVALDADELLTPFFDSIDFEHWQQLPQGTIIQFFGGNISPNFENYWSLNHQNFGYIDDGRTFQTGLIHVPRLFTPDEDETNVYECKELGVMHFQYVDWERMKSKHRWYQCYERVHFPKKSAVEIYRRYHHMYNPNILTTKFPNSWKENYGVCGVDITAWNKEKIYWWDYKVKEYLQYYGEYFFSQIDIWDCHWNAVANEEYKFSGGVGDKLLLIYLRFTKKLVYRKGFRKLVRFFDEMLMKWTL